MVFQDGGSSTGDPKQAGPWNATYVFDNLMAASQMPVTIGVFISPGELPLKEPGGKPVSNRSVEYDIPDGTYGRFLLEKILPSSVTRSLQHGRRAGRLFSTTRFWIAIQPVQFMSPELAENTWRPAQPFCRLIGDEKCIESA